MKNLQLNTTPFLKDWSATSGGIPSNHENDDVCWTVKAVKYVWRGLLLWCYWSVCVCMALRSSGHTCSAWVMLHLSSNSDMWLPTVINMFCTSVSSPEYEEDIQCLHHKSIQHLNDQICNVLSEVPDIRKTHGKFCQLLHLFYCGALMFPFASQNNCF